MANRIVRWNPVREMAAMQSAMDRMFDEFGRGIDGFEGNGRNWLALDVNENDDAYVVHADLPGIDPENINITLHDNVLTITAENERSETQENERRVLTERSYGKFTRSLTLPNTVDSDAVEADYENGVLHLTLPKSEKAKPRQISVKKS